jgi:RIO kinase 1
MDLATFEKRFWKEERRIKDADMRKIEKEVFDERTVDTIYRIALKGELDYLGGVIATGKEANVFKGYTKEGEARAYKIYRTETADFKAMWPYIEGDRRFDGVRRQRRHILLAWCRKEYSNLMIAKEAGCTVPQPIMYKNNVLVMQFIGDETAAPLIKDVELDDPAAAYKHLVRDLNRLYHAGLVHADVSEFNVLWWQDLPWLIDIGQGVLTTHPRAKAFLERDAENVAKYFTKLGVRTTPAECLKAIIQE